MKNKTIYMLSVIALLLLAIGGSYAYFAINQNIGRLSNFVVDFSDDYNLTVEGIKTSNITISDIAMFGASEDKEVYNETADFTVKIEDLTTESTGITCNYDYVWRWDLTKDNYKKSTGAELEYTVEGPFALQNVPDYDSYSFVLGSDKIVVAPGASTATKVVQITTKFYNLGTVDQSGHSNKSYQGGVVIDNVDCK